MLQLLRSRRMEIMTFSIRMTNEEKKLAESYASLHSMSVGEAIKHAFFEKIEDEYDIALADTIHQEMIDNNEKPIPIEEVWKDLNI